MICLFHGVARWVTFVFIFTALFLNMEAWGRVPRLRHSHRKLEHCAKCPPGWGVWRRCNAGQDTLCKPCSPGSYSPHHSYHAPCWVCSRCGPGLFEAHACHSTADTVCDDCLRPGAASPTNPDFLHKCLNSSESLPDHDVRWIKNMLKSRQ